jgi:hypothetical protein
VGLVRVAYSWSVIAVHAVAQGSSLADTFEEKKLICDELRKTPGWTHVDGIPEGVGKAEVIGVERDTLDEENGAVWLSVDEDGSTVIAEDVEVIDTVPWLFS